MDSQGTSAVPRRAVAAACAVLAAAAVHAAAGFEAAPTFEAAKILPAAQVKGPHHAVEARVPLQGLYRQYKITSDYGAFGADGDLLLLIRLKEVDALARLAETSEAEVALKAVGGALGGAAKGAAHAVANPKETVEGIPGGVGKMFGRVGRKAKRTAEKGKEEIAGDDSKPAEADSKSTTAAAADATASAAKGVLGVSAGRRRWAQELGVDPYTSNPVLGAALDKVGQIDAAGRFTTKLVPGMALVSTVASVDKLVYAKSPEELLKHIEERLKAIGVSDQLSKDLRLNKNIRVSLQARIVAALDALGGVADRAAFLERADAIDSETAAFYYADSAEMLERFHRTKGALARLVPANGAAVALTKDGRLVHLVPADYVPWTSQVGQAVDGAVQRAKEDFPSARLEAWITGDASDRTRQELTGRGWKIQTQTLRPEPAPPAAK
jgi:hypothetical protein